MRRSLPSTRLRHFGALAVLALIVAATTLGLAHAETPLPAAGQAAVVK
jgi:hypothetical protein